MTLGTRWERHRYALWAPLYDFVVSPLRRARRRSVDALALRDGERVLLVGAGTGEDLSFIPAEVFTVATDLTPAMLWRARHKAREGDQLAVMDGHALALRNGTFDAVVLHLILAVIPDPALCLAEAVRVLRAGGRIAVLDKFVADRHKASIGRRLLNRVTRPIATDITRRLDDIILAVEDEGGSRSTTRSRSTPARPCFGARAGCKSLAGAHLGLAPVLLMKPRGNH